MIDANLHLATRRSSLFALAAAALTSAVGETSSIIAKPSSKKRRRKKCVDRCPEQVSQCTQTLSLACDTGNNSDECKAFLLPCCNRLATCNVADALQCLLN